MHRVLVHGVQPIAVGDGDGAWVEQGCNGEEPQTVAAAATVMISPSHSASTSTAFGDGLRASSTGPTTSYTRVSMCCLYNCSRTCWHGMWSVVSKAHSRVGGCCERGSHLRLVQLIKRNVVDASALLRALPQVAFGHSATLLGLPIGHQRHPLLVALLHRRWYVGRPR